MTIELPTLTVGTARAVQLPLFTDARGSLSFAETGAHVPFVPQRYFAISGVQAGATRGDHAHRALHQFLVCLQGACTLRLSDGHATDTLSLASPALGVHARPMTWCTLTDFTPDAVVLVLASDLYDAADYIHDRDEFLRLVAATPSTRS